MLSTQYDITLHNSSLACFPFKPYFHDVRTPHNKHYDNFLLAIIVMNAVMAAVASCINAVVIYTISRTPSLRTPSNILILGLAISDFSFGIFAQPLYCLFKFSELHRDLDSYCCLSSVLVYIGVTLAAISFGILTAITADRFLAVHLHLRYQDIITTKRAGIVLGFIWVCCVCCAPVFVRFALHKQTLLIALCIFVIFFSLNVYFIVRVCLVIRRHSLQIKSQQSVQQGINMARFRKSAKAMFWVQGTFILCYVPYACLIVPFSALRGRSGYGIRTAFIIAETILSMNGVFNPIIYCWRIVGMRSAAVTLIRKMFCRTEINQ